jgi:septal ring factor EnvC (AmiA/AmiB activator)
VAQEPLETPTPAETAAEPERPAASLGVEERRKELAELRRRLGELKGRYEASRKREADLKGQLETADLDLQIQTGERRVLDLRKAEAAREAARAAAGRDAAQRDADARRADLGTRMAALYRLGRLGYLRPLAAADSASSFLGGLRLLTHLARRDATLLARHEEAAATLAAREQELAVKKRELADLAAESRRKEVALASARSRKAALLAQVHETARVEERQVSTLEDKSARLAALLELLEGRGRSLAPGAASIHKYRGALDWPLRGKVAVPFGRIANPKFPKTFLRSSGWTLEAPTGSTVHAVFSGEVVYAQWLKGYGNLVVVDHGGGVFTLYGRLATGTIGRGELVSIGDRIGILGESPEDEPAGLYFEIRDNRTSADPATWLR